jgi:hypothetical protein
VLYEKESVTSYHNREPIRNNERLLVVGINSEVVKFNFPIYIVKSLIDLSKMFSSQPKPPKEE